MAHIILKSENVFIDETPVNMLAPGKGKVQQAYMWVLVGGQSKDPPYRVYEFYENRKHSNASDLLKGYDGVLHSDKYVPGVYHRILQVTNKIEISLYGFDFICHLQNPMVDTRY